MEERRRSSWRNGLGSLVRYISPPAKHLLDQEKSLARKLPILTCLSLCTCSQCPAIPRGGEFKVLAPRCMATNPLLHVNSTFLCVVCTVPDRQRGSIETDSIPSIVLSSGGERNSCKPSHPRDCLHCRPNRCVKRIERAILLFGGLGQ